MDNFRKYLVEFIGAFFLVFTIGATAIAFGSESTIAPLAIGFALMVMVYAGGYISGGHYNPAVSLAAVVRGALAPIQWIPYALFQVLGGVCAAFLINFMAGGPAEAGATFTLSNVVIAEFLFTFALCYVVLLTATSKRTEGNSYYGLAIGSTVMVGAFAVGGLCLGAFNPAVAISTLVFGVCCCAKLAWITVLVNLVAGVCAGLVFKFLDKE